MEWGEIGPPAGLILQPTATLQPLPVRDSLLAPRRNRDRELLRYVGRHGLVAIDHVIAAIGVGRTAAYRRAAACIEPACSSAWRSSAKSRASCAPPARAFPTPASAFRWPRSPRATWSTLRCATVARRAEAHFGANAVLSERELAFAERLEERKIASAQVGRAGSRHLASHRPDLAVLREDEGTLAIDVELTPKAPRRLVEILRGWRCAHWVFHYFCAPGQAYRAVQRAIDATGAAEKVALVEVPMATRRTSWLCHCRSWQRRRALQGPGGPASPLACGSGSAPAIRCARAGVKASQRSADEASETGTRRPPETSC